MDVQVFGANGTCGKYQPQFTRSSGAAPDFAPWRRVEEAEVDLPGVGHLLARMQELEGLLRVRDAMIGAQAADIAAFGTTLGLSRRAGVCMGALGAGRWRTWRSRSSRAISPCGGR